MLIAEAGLLEEAVVHEKRPEAESPPPSPASSTVTEELLNYAVSSTVVDAEFVDSVFISPAEMQPEKSAVLPEAKDGGNKEDSADEETPKLRRSSRLIATPSNASPSIPAMENNRKRKSETSTEKKKPVRNAVPKKRRRSEVSMTSVASDTSDMGMPVLEAADPTVESSEVADTSMEADEPGLLQEGTSAATATVELATAHDQALAKLIATFKTGGSAASVSDSTGSDGRVASPFPMMTPPPMLTSCVEDNECNCKCCRKLERYMATVNQQMGEMTELLQKLVKQQKYPYPLTVKEGLPPCTLQIGSSKTKFRPASKDEMSLQGSSNSPAGSHRSKSATVKRSQDGDKKIKITGEENGFSHFNDDGTPTQRYLWFAGSILRHPCRTVSVSKLKSIGPASSENALFKSSSAQLIVQVMESMARAGLLRCVNRGASTLDLQFVKVDEVPAEEVDEYLESVLTSTEVPQRSP
uniref:BEN domain-containing protein n=1 Tax=Steinernema glaseri TaxID=37863 RepID=A0A1I8AJ82_9BILA